MSYAVGSPASFTRGPNYIDFDLDWRANLSVNEVSGARWESRLYTMRNFGGFVLSSRELFEESK